ncbi:MAG: hypothetical protein FJ012_11250 [Chloroflexi bacterium]|nr:hypothetical protein [Chloroflexota bacterium]
MRQATEAGVSWLQEHSFLYAVRLPVNDILEQEIEHLLERHEGELPEKPVIRYYDFQYQAKSWDHRRRVVAKVEWDQGQLFPRVGFVVTTQVQLQLFVLAYNLGNFLRTDWACPRQSRTGHYAAFG